MLLPTLSDQLVLAGLVDLDGTFFIQLGIFIVFWLFLQAIVVKPLTRTQQNRYAHLEGARENAESMDRRAVESWERYNGELTAARNEAVAVRDQLRDTATDSSSEMLATVRTEAGATLNTARDLHVEERERFLAQIAPHVDELATVITDSVLAGKTRGGAA